MGVPYKPKKPSQTIDVVTGDARPAMPQLDVKPLALRSPAKRVKGARRVLTDQEIDAFCNALDMPATFEVACGIVAVPERTMRAWIAKGEEI